MNFINIDLITMKDDIFDLQISADDQPFESHASGICAIVLKFCLIRPLGIFIPYIHPKTKAKSRTSICQNHMPNSMRENVHQNLKPIKICLTAFMCSACGPLSSQRNETSSESTTAIVCCHLKT